MVYEKLSYLDGLCPNCGGRVSDERLKKGLPCEKCWPFEFSPLELIEKDKDTIKKAENYLKNLKFLLDFQLKVKDFIEYFERLTGNKPWNLQITWAKRIFLKESGVSAIKLHLIPAMEKLIL